jgi:high-affinity K+ transport system ATPase subunit B
MPGVGESEMAEAAQMPSLADETPEGRSIVVLAKERFGLREHDLGASARTSCPSPLSPGFAGGVQSGVQIEAQPRVRWVEDVRGRWLYHCHVESHMRQGTIRIYQVR